MKTRKKIVITALSCIVLGTLAYFAFVFPFYEFAVNDYDTSLDKILSLDYLKTLMPLFIIIGLSAAGIVAVVWVRKLMLKKIRITFALWAEIKREKRRNKSPYHL